jgi:hypothetical protein
MGNARVVGPDSDGIAETKTDLVLPGVRAFELSIVPFFIRVAP